MGEQIHTTATQEVKQEGYIGDFKKLIPTVILAILTAFVTSWWNSEKNQADLSHRLQTIEQKAENNAKQISQNSLVLQGNAIRLAELGVIQNNALEQIKDLKKEQTDMLNKR